MSADHAFKANLVTHNQCLLQLHVRQNKKTSLKPTFKVPVKALPCTIKCSLSEKLFGCQSSDNTIWFGFYGNNYSVKLHEHTRCRNCTCIPTNSCKGSKFIGCELIQQHGRCLYIWALYKALACFAYHPAICKSDASFIALLYTIVALRKCSFAMQGQH